MQKTNGVIKGVSGMLKAIVLAAILGMLFPVAGHVVGRNLTSDWLRFSISLICLAVSILITYTIALMFHWGANL
jgi:1,4-dihydroxy-2-naphthoate octaprenyltransferase